jgi:hypothetical protein
MMRTKSAYREKPAENIPPAAVTAEPEAPAVAVEVHCGLFFDLATIPSTLVDSNQSSD